MIEIEKYPCNDRNEAHTRERYWIEKLNGGLNSNVPTRNAKEYYESNKDNIIKRTKQYYENNKDDISQKKKSIMKTIKRNT
jgi:hypothetical protein